MSLNLRRSIIKEDSFSPNILGTGQLAVTLTGLVGSAGQAMGVMGLTYTQPELAYGILEYQTNSAAPTRIKVRLDK